MRKKNTNENENKNKIKYKWKKINPVDRRSGHGYQDKMICDISVSRKGGMKK